MIIQKYITANRQTGVSLIEILVTTLILGVGLLGVAALQISSISSNQEGLFASQATAIAEDYASRIRASKTSTQLPNSNINYAAYLAVYHNGNNQPFDCAEPATMCRANDCTPADFAIYAQYEACNAASDLLPGGQFRAINNGIRLSLVVDWDSSEGRLDTGNLSVVNANCLPLTGSDTRNCVIMEIVP